MHIVWTRTPVDKSGQLGNLFEETNCRVPLEYVAVPQPRNVICLLNDAIMHVKQKQHAGVSVHVLRETHLWKVP